MLALFCKISNLVECYFSSKIKVVQFDWDGAYHSLHKIFETQGSLHCVSCHLTHQQNRAIKSKHHHMVETGLMLLSQATIPHSFWDDAFLTACYLITRMPTLILKNRYPYKALFNWKCDYFLLLIFDCACWPNLRTYNSNKFQPQSLQYIFLDYSHLHKGYKCLHIPTK